MDVKTAFLYGLVEEIIYVIQPTGYSDGSTRVCKLRKALYGLKQSPRIWYQTLAKFLHELGFRPLNADLSVFAKDDMIIAIYVDNLLICGAERKEINKVKDALKAKFHMSDLGPVSFYLGMAVTRDRGNKILRLGQQAYLEKILKDHGMWECKAVAVPMDGNLTSSLQNYQATDVFRTQYQSAVGSLMYAMLSTRPDLAFSVSVVSRYASNPNPSHWQAVKRIFRYIRGTPSLQLTYRGTLSKLEGYTDADWAGDYDTRRSTSGYIFNVGSGAISWSSKRQPTVASSSCEAEYMGQTQATKEAVWLKLLLQELNTPCSIDVTGDPSTHPAIYSVIIHCDNQGAIALGKNPQAHARSKHIGIQWHYQREKIEDGTVELRYIPTDQQIADGLTKPLSKDKFLAFRNAVGLE